MQQSIVFYIPDLHLLNNLGDGVAKTNFYSTILQLLDHIKFYHGWFQPQRKEEETYLDLGSILLGKLAMTYRALPLNGFFVVRACH